MSWLRLSVVEMDFYFAIFSKSFRVIRKKYKTKNIDKIKYGEHEIWNYFLVTKGI